MSQNGIRRLSLTQKSLFKLKKKIKNQIFESKEALLAENTNKK